MTKIKSFEPIFKKDLFDGMVRGINKTADAVGLTLGPNGRTVLSHLNMAFHSTKDGVTVARTVKLGDPIESLGQKLLLDAASSTVNQAGDGTTTSVVLSRELILRSLEMLDKGHRFLTIKRAYQDCRDIAIKYVEENKIDVDGNTELLDKVATISANNDAKLGKIVSDVVSRVGENGIVEIELNYEPIDKSEYTRGYRLDKGYADAQFMGLQSKQTLEDCKVLLLGNKDFSPFVGLDVAKQQAFYNHLNQIRASGECLLIVGFRIDPKFISLLINNTGLVKGEDGGLISNRYWINVVNIPYYDEGNFEYMRDIAVSTGATILCEEEGYGVFNFTPDLLGSCNKVIITQNETTFIEGNGNEELIEARAKVIKEEMELHLLEKSREVYGRRYSFLTAGAAKIWFSGHSDIEKREKYDRIDDCVRAIKSAIGKGILPGGGTTMLRASERICKELDVDLVESSYEDTYKEAVRQYVEAMRVPFRKIMENSYYTEGEILGIEYSILSNGDKNYGYNALTGQYVDMIDDGVVDAALVTMSSIKNATSVTEQFVTSGCAIIESEIER